ncbi:MAG TPA: alpha/beta hydrolase [Kineosporiaceae bacterium]|nr:alpha/beta hydrolase [Kineosporiaceae bacterium]
MDLTEHDIVVAGRQLAYLESQGRGRPVVLVHGNSSSARTWRPLLDGPFGRQFCCLALDLPGHGRSAPPPQPEDYCLPGYADLLVRFARVSGAADAVFVGWNLGGHILLEAAPALPDAAGFVIVGTPPVGSAEDLRRAFPSGPAMAAGFTAELDEATARSCAERFVTAGSDHPLEEFVADILATDGTARSALGAGIGEGRFTDERAVVAGLTVPLAVLHGAGEQVVSLDYLRALTAPTLWRGEVQVIPGAGHAPHQETPDTFAALLTDFIADVDRTAGPAAAGGA